MDKQLNIFYLHNFVIDSAAVKTNETYLPRMEASLLVQCIITEQHSNRINLLG